MLTVENLDCRDKTVFLRLDLNVPLDENCKIRDDTRIRAALPTLEHLIKQSSRLVIASHLGRPKGKYDPRLSLKPVARMLDGMISPEVRLAPDVIGPEVEEMKRDLDKDSVLLLENLRFHPGEKENDPEFSRHLAAGIDYFVNDAFGTCHRSHASVVAIAPLVEKAAAGFLLQKELDYLGRIIHSPKIPFTAILGGAKVSDKIPVIRNLINKADSLLVGGAMAYTFFASTGCDAGTSLVEADKKHIAGELLNQAKSQKIQFLLPVDHIAAASPEETEDIRTLSSFPFPHELMGLDIGPRTVRDFQKIIARSQTIFWNGPMGVFEKESFSKGTMAIAKAVADSRALSIIGGGDSVAAVQKAGVADKISHISTGGGAALEYIANETLPGIQVLKEK